MEAPPLIMPLPEILLTETLPLAILKLETPLLERAIAEVLIALDRLEGVAMDSAFVVADKLVNIDGEKVPLLGEEAPATLLEAGV